MCPSLFPRLPPRQAPTITSQPLTQPFPRSSLRPPIVPVAVTVRTPRSRLQRQGDIQPRAFPSLKRSTAASCGEQVKWATGGSSHTRAAPPCDGGGGAAALLPGSDHNALGSRAAVTLPRSPPAAITGAERGRPGGRGWGDAKVPDVPASRGGGGERLPSAGRRGREGGLLAGAAGRGANLALG